MINPVTGRIFGATKYGTRACRCRTGFQGRQERNGGDERVQPSRFLHSQSSSIYFFIDATAATITAERALRERHRSLRPGRFYSLGWRAESRYVPPRSSECISAAVCRRPRQGRILRFFFFFFYFLIATELQCPNSGAARCSLPNTRFLTASDGYTKDLRRALLSSFSPTGSVIRRVREIGVGWPPVRWGARIGTGSVCDASRGLSSEGRKPRRRPCGGVRGGFHCAARTTGNAGAGSLP